MTLYKFLKSGGLPAHGGAGKWNLPHGNRPGKWMPEITGALVACEKGYHLCEEKDLTSWIAEDLYIAEYRGETIVADDKMVTREARLLSRVTTWNERTARLFACDCAERALKLIGDKADARSIDAVRIARLFADGKATQEDLAAASDAARAATWGAATWAASDAARAAASDAARAAAWYAARDAAWYAAGAAAGAAAEAAARDAEIEWQTARLMWYLNGD